MDNQLIVSITNSITGIAAALITALGATYSVYRIRNYNKLKADLELAYKDLEALYMIESYHLKNEHSQSKVAVRKLVEKNEGMVLSGKHTPSQLKRRLMLLERKYL